MKFPCKKLEKILSVAGKAIVLLTLAAVVFSPLAQLGGTPVAMAQSSEESKNCLPNAGKNCDPPPKDALTCTLNNPSVCLASVVYVFTVGLGGSLAYVGGFMFDTTVSLSLNSSAYALDFLSSGWTAARDLANMAFILILVYIAFMIMFQAETARTLQMLAWVIFIALIINFSFFFTRVAIDAGNILAVQFYNSIDAPTMQKSINGTDSSTGAMANLGAGIAEKLEVSGTAYANTKDLTASIMQALNIQELLNNQSFQSFAAQGDFGTKLIVLSFLYIAIGACYFILAAMFFAVSVKFLVRIVVLWFLIIASPLAFICKAVPRSEVSSWYDKWQHELVNHAFYPAFFLFIFYFIHAILMGLKESGGILGSMATDLNSLATAANQGPVVIVSMVANVAIRLGFVVALLYIALKASEYMGVKGAGVAHNITNRVGGLAKYSASLPVRGAFAGAASAGRNTVGRASYIASRSATVQNLAANSILGRPVKAALGGLEKASFDIRGTSVGKNMKSVAGEAGGKGGFSKKVDDRSKDIERRAKEMKTAGNETAIQEQQKVMEKEARGEYDKVHGKGKYDEQKEKFIKDREAAKVQEVKWEEEVRKATLTHNVSGAADARKNLDQAKLNRKYAEDGLKVIDVTSAQAKKALESMDKDRIRGFAERIGKGNLGNLGSPSRGSIIGAAKALGSISEKSKAQKLAEAAKEALKEDEGGDDGPKGGGSGGTGGGGGKGGSGGSGSGASGPAAGGGTGSAGGGTSHASAGGSATVSLDKHSLEELRGIRENMKEISSGLATRLGSHPALNKNSAPTVTLNSKQIGSLGSAIGKAAQNPPAHTTLSAANDNQKPEERKEA